MKSILTLAFCACFGIAFASFNIGSNEAFDKRKDKDKDKIKLEKYSLKNIRRPASFFSLSSLSNVNRDTYSSQPSFLNGSFQLNPVSEENVDNSSDIYVNSTMRLKAGNSVVIYPYTYKVKPAPLGMFKTPTPNNR
ncbi:hypothetical protein [Arachidicoccus ginsenosidimutans]|uniref:hypothetical protein n=1 Tax=Arachidicoccus sp. BS20 TaxID=1850526 RepID=UPI0012E846DA|nr:hypothetical protein [Arachidicoccus sp. BS20]